ncbi:hypothetical protein [Acinetobacter baumannii]|uniref:hypothetical protein n=1 Tax=Acinetobacter baumannii TaxID=470 RepID=UPI001072224E|nr:hypothetical protein [Acinetobacter baumannii]QBR78471.1 hypothetical protein E4K03_15795 [Acinetobacter baumannii]
MNLEFLNKQQAISYFNKQTDLNVDRRIFLIYCLENEIPIKYKAITDFKAIAGFFISADEYKQLNEHRKLKRDFKEREDNTIFAQKNFDEQVSSLAYNFCEQHLSNEYSNDLPLTKLNALVKASKLVRETLEYKELLEKKDSIDRITQIKEAARIIYLDDVSGGLVFHEENIFSVKSGIYDFLDSSLSIKGLIKEEIKNYQDGFYDSYIPTESRFFISENLFYWKADKKAKDIFDSFYTDEIFQQGFLKSDIDLLIKKLFQKEKPMKEVDILHPRTANNASKIISALCELNGLDITQPYGNSNKEIMGVLDRLGTPLSKDVVGDWLKLAHENTK